MKLQPTFKREYLSFKVIIFLVFSSFFSFGQDTIPCNCCSPEHQQFNFWIGDWNVFDTAGVLIGTNSILSLQDNCALQENWVSPNMTGTSYNYYDKKNGTWNQVWIDNQGGTLILKGALENGAMFMRSKLIPGSKVDFYYNQIKWTPNNDGSVTQQWDVFDKNDVLLTTLFKGNYVLVPTTE